MLHRLLLTLCLVPACLQAAPQDYAIVTKLSRISFQFAHQDFMQLFGTVRFAPGRFVFDAEDWSRSRIEAMLPLASLDMGDAEWNQQIRGDRAWSRLFLGPEIQFRSQRLERSDAHQGVLNGELTLGGVTRPIALQLRVNRVARNAITGQPSVDLSASTRIRRSDFGLDAYRSLVGDEVDAQVQMEGAQEVPAP